MTKELKRCKSLFRAPRRKKGVKKFSSALRAEKGAQLFFSVFHTEKSQKAVERNFFGASRRNRKKVKNVIVAGSKTQRKTTGTYFLRAGQDEEERLSECVYSCLGITEPRFLRKKRRRKNGNRTSSVRECASGSGTGTKLVDATPPPPPPE